MNESGHQFWARKNEELVKIQLFYNAIRKELDDLEELVNSLVATQRETLSFDWPDDVVFNEWKNQVKPIGQVAEEEVISQEEDQIKEESTK